MEAYDALNFPKVAAARSIFNLLASHEVLGVVERWLRATYGIEPGSLRSAEFWKYWDEHVAEITARLGNELLIYDILFSTGTQDYLIPESLDKYLEHPHDGSLPGG